MLTGHGRTPAGLLAVACLCFASLPGCSGGSPAGSAPAVVGVMLTMSGTEGLSFRDTLEWARENINNAGGVNGMPLEFVYRDLAEEDKQNVLEDFLNDSRIQAIIGPNFSADLFDLAPMAIEAEKPLVTPAATSVDLSKAFAGKRYIWRTVESDIAQTKALLLLAAAKGARRIALITGEDLYGKTFFDWCGFYATELGLDLAGLRRTDLTQENTEAATEQLLDLDVDILIATPTTTEAAVWIAESVLEKSPTTPVLFSEAMVSPVFVEQMGDRAEGFEGTMPTSDVASGFDWLYEKRFGRKAHVFAANTYDAAILLAYALELSDGRGGSDLVGAMEEVVGARGSPVGWDASGIAQALDAIEAGNAEGIDVEGAAGPMEFGAEVFMDVLSSTYAHWRIRGGEFMELDYASSADQAVGERGSLNAIFETYATEARKQRFGEDPVAYDPPEKTGLKAFILAGSLGWENYRHQADALAFYRHLKSNGVSDDDILLVLADDLVGDPSNPQAGVVRNEVGGENLYVDVQVDRRLRNLAPGEMSALAASLGSTASDNVVFFYSGHGGYSGLSIQEQEDPDSAIISPVEFAAAVHMLKFRRFLGLVEACHAGLLGEALEEQEVPGAALLAGANSGENSLATNYDGSIDAWLADEFSYAMDRILRTVPEYSILQTYETAYRCVPGAHVTLYNARYFGNISAIPLAEFVEP